MTEPMKGYLKGLSEMAENMSIEDTDSEPRSFCEYCNNTGMVKYADLPVSHRLYEKLVPCTQCQRGADIRDNILRTRINDSALPKLYRDADIYRWLKNINSKGKLLAYAIALEFVESQKHIISSHGVANRLIETAHIPEIRKHLEIPEMVFRGFAFWGPVGTGKTWLAAAVMNELLQQGEIVMYMRAQDIIQSLTDTWNKRNQDNEATSEESLLEQYKTVPYLFIDDMNIESRRGELLPHQRNYMETIIRYRSNNELHTFITCNINLDQFYEQWGERTADVLAADLYWAKVGGDKLRRTQIALDIDL